MRKIISILTLILIIGFISGLKSFNKKINDLNKEPNGNIDGIAVLTGGKGRIKLGLDLWRKNTDIKLIVSGVDKNFSVSSILPSATNADNIYLDKLSESTFQNSKEISKWIKIYNLKNINVVTSYYHIPRSMLLLKEFSPSTSFFAYPVQKASLKNKSISKSLLFHLFLAEEYIKYLLSIIIVIML